MKGLIALFAFSVWLLWFYYRDAKERALVSSEVWIAVVWVVIYGSRPVTEWFIGAWESPNRLSSSDEGNPIEAFISVSLIIAGLVVLLRRSIRLSSLIRDNIWLVVFYIFWLTSVAWSDYPVITLKRLFKDLGNVVMVLVVLTEKEPIIAIKAVCSRVAYLCIPLSVLLIRYYPDWGRAYVGYDRSELMWVGVATHKNTLGVLAFVGGLFILSDLLDCKEKTRKVIDRSMFVSRGMVLLMCWYLLVIANSQTSLVCAVLGSLMLIVLGIPSVRRRPGKVEAIGLGSALLFLMVDSVFNIKQIVVEDLLGRDMTLTTRTNVWPILISYQDNPLLGSGFNSFWAGQRLAQLHEEVATIIQAHNGYLETYLNGGLVGVGLLAVLLVSAYLHIRKKLALGMPDAGIRFVILILAIIYNNSEASFNKVGLMWFVTVYAMMEYQCRGQLRSRRAVSSLTEPIRSSPHCP